MISPASDWMLNPCHEHDSYHSDTVEESDGLQRGFNFKYCFWILLWVFPHGLSKSIISTGNLIRRKRGARDKIWKHLQKLFYIWSFRDLWLYFRFSIMFSLTFQFHSCDLPFLNSILHRNHCPVERSLHKFPNGMKTGISLRWLERNWRSYSMEYSAF